MATVLAAGDIALVGYSSDTAGKSFAFVTLVALQPGTVILFTDNGWLAAGGFRTGEGVFTYTVPAGGLPAGSVITVSGLTGSFNPSTAGDQIIAYQVNGAVITPIFAVDFADNNTSWSTNATSSNTSAVPAGLAAGSTALAFGPDNAAYTGPTSGTQTQLLAAIANPANWTTDDNNPVGYQPSFTVISSSAALISISDVSVTEGLAGDMIMTFTVTRSNNGSAFSVDYGTANGTATAGADYDAAAGTLTFAVGGPLTQTVSVTVHGDGTMEADETLVVNLSNIQATSGTAVFADSQGQGTILNDDVTLTAIYDIQGAGHRSIYEGQRVITEGVVTAIDTTGGRGFWIQDAAGDGNDATSDAVFVFTNAAVTVTVGQLVRVDGTVTEFQGSDVNNLTVTEITSPTVSVIGTGSVTATVIGAGGRVAPTEVIDNDDFAVFDPGQDAIDFYESLEGMLVTVNNATALGETDGGATWIVPDAGAGATGLNGQGGLTLSPGDYNPERIQVWIDGGVFTGPAPSYVLGDNLGQVTGIMHYFGGDYELVATTIQNTTSTTPAPNEVTTLAGDRGHMTVAAYNVENLDPNDGAAKFAALGHDIAYNLGSPDVISLEEVQDADGAGNGTNYSGAVTAQLLIDAIVAAGGPRYVYVEIAPTANNTTGGESNGNIRNGFLYNPDRVDFVEGSLRQILDLDPARGDAFNNSRRPLVADFVFHGEVVTAISVHNYSRGGSDALFGENQPAAISGEQRRADQTAAVVEYLQSLYASNPDAQIAVMGDFNGFYFENAQVQLETDGGLYNLTFTLVASERYSYVFEGNAQQIDHLLVSLGLADQAVFDIVHLNAGSANPVTDHDALLALLYVNTAPTADGETYYGAEDSPILTGGPLGVLANDDDINDDVLTAVLQVTTLYGLLDFHADGSFTYTPNADWNGTDSFIYIAYDEFGEASGATTVTLVIDAVNDGPIGEDDSASTTEDHVVLIDVLANDSDVDGDSLSIVLDSATSALGSSVSVVGGQIRYVADADSFDLLAPGQTVQDVITYRVSDGNGGLSDPVLVTVTVGEGGDNRTLYGTNKGDSFTDAAGWDTTWFGGNGEDVANGGDGADTLYGENGKDALYGGAGADTLIGGNGDDSLWGGAGADTFVFSTNSATDTIMDFNPGEDVILTGGGGTAFSFRNLDYNRDGVVDAVQIDGPGVGHVILNGWSVSALQAGGYLSASGGVIGGWLHG